MRLWASIPTREAATFAIEATVMAGLSIGAAASALYHLVRWAIG